MESSGCGRIASTPVPAPRIWLLASPAVTGFPAQSADSSAGGALIVLDSAAFRPVLVKSGSGVATFTSFQGSRYHPEAVRAIAETPAVRDTFSRRVAGIAGSASALLLDFQEMPPSDLPSFIELARAIGNAARAGSIATFGIIVPAGDTLAYPASLLARVADVIVIRVGTEHRPGTPAGPPSTPDFIRRQLGGRLIGLGATRLAAELPLHGYIWNSDGAARIITYREANERILREGGAFRRDPASRFLTAEGRDGSSIWVPDAETIRSLIAVAQSRGVNTVALTGVTGSDPAIAGLVVRR
jgi:hypothetical protein